MECENIPNRFVLMRITNTFVSLLQLVGWKNKFLSRIEDKNLLSVYMCMCTCMLISDKNSFQPKYTCRKMKENNTYTYFYLPNIQYNIGKVSHNVKIELILFLFFCLKKKIRCYKNTLYSYILFRFLKLHLFFHMKFTQNQVKDEQQKKMLNGNTLKLYTGKNIYIYQFCSHFTFC